MPRRSGYPQGSGEVLERDRGSKSPVSLQPPPRGANKIYTYDVVFSIGEARKKIQSQTPLPLRSPKLYPALSPRRRRMTLVSRSRTIFSGNGSLTLRRTQTCTNYIPSPSQYKSFAGAGTNKFVLKSDRLPRPPVSPKLYPALSPRRRRMTLVSRSRTIYVGNGRNHIGTHTDLHKLYPYPLFIKVLRSFFKSDRSPVSPRSPRFPSSPRIPASPVHIGGCNADH